MHTIIIKEDLLTCLHLLCRWLHRLLLELLLLLPHEAVHEGVLAQDLLLQQSHPCLAQGAEACHWNRVSG